LALTGAARGCGWQNLCASINLGAYYVVGIPSAILFAFIFHIGGMVSFILTRILIFKGGVCVFVYEA
jgi:Na+-driven multidrug efflux pump